MSAPRTSGVPLVVAPRDAFPDVVEGPGGPLDRWRPGDEVVLSRLVAQSVEHLKVFMAFAWDEPITLEARRALLESWDGSWRRGATAHYKVPDGAGAPCGLISLLHDMVPQEVAVGYWIVPSEEGRGRVTRAAALLVAEAFGRDEVDTVVITHDAANERSAAIPRRLGFARRRAETHGPWAGGGAFVTVRWEASRPWRPLELGYSAAKTPTGHETPVPPMPQ